MRTVGIGSIMCIAAVLAANPTGVTAGRAGGLAVKWGCKLSRGQAERILKDMVREGYAVKITVKYRGNMNQHLYHLSEMAAIVFSSIATDYSEGEKQLPLPEVYP